jgi:HemY protein
MRILLTLIFLTALSFAATWVVDHDGVMTIRWMGYQIDTTMTFLIFVVLLVSLVAACVFYLIIWLAAAPTNYRKNLLEKKREKGLVALTEGFAAVAAGDAKQARALTKRAENALGSIGLTRLLSAQAAHLDGDIALEREQYHAMLEDKSTEIIAVKGLLIAAKEEGDLGQAITLAEKAVTLQENTSWALSMLFDLYKRTQKWHKALETLEQLYRKKMVDKAKYIETKGLLSLAIAIGLSGQKLEKEALSYFADAYKPLPSFAPAAVFYGEALVDSGNKRKALKILENSWKQSPHLRVGACYMEQFENDTAAKRMKQAERLYHMQPEHPDSHILLAKAAMRGGELSKARNHLKMALTSEETKLICSLMAELETMENATQDVIQKWYHRSEQAPHDENWVCTTCNHISHQWQPNCTNCESFGSYQWQTPGRQTDVTPIG